MNSLYFVKFLARKNGFQFDILDNTTEVFKQNN